MADVEIHMYICKPVSEMPIPITQSVRRKCSQCGQQVWSGLDALEDMEERGVAYRIMCMPCCDKIRESGDEFTIGFTGPRSMTNTLRVLFGIDMGGSS